MRFYEYDYENLTYNKLTLQKFIKRNYKSWIIGSIIIGWLSITLFRMLFLPQMGLHEIANIKPQYEEIMLLQTQYEFSENKFVNEIKRLNLKYPHIVYAQAMLESSNFSSKIFKENNNMFGMKQAQVRINLARGTQYGHAYFDSWEECLYDFAYHRATYLSNLKSENDYYQYLGKHYAEDSGYIDKLKTLVNKHQIKNKFI